jgi:hypothetical protein
MAGGSADKVEQPFPSDDTPTVLAPVDLCVVEIDSNTATKELVQSAVAQLSLRNAELTNKSQKESTPCNPGLHNHPHAMLLMNQLQLLEDGGGGGGGGGDDSTASEDTAKEMSEPVVPAETPSTASPSEDDDDACDGGGSEQLDASYDSSSGSDNDMSHHHEQSVLLVSHTPQLLHDKDCRSSSSQQHDRAESPPTISTTAVRTTTTAYNPITCHSPQRKSPARREIMGMSVFSSFLSSSSVQQNPRPEQYPQLLLLETAPSEDDSEVALEMAAQHIRTEMLHTEMLELAVEAERAAEAGQDRFAAKLCAFPDHGTVDDDDDDSNDHRATMMIPQRRTTTAATAAISQRKLSMRRCLSEGSYALDPVASSQPPSRSTVSTQLPRRRSVASSLLVATSTAATAHTARDKLSVVELRDVNEVFPSFRQFHTHLRTHFFRSSVEQDQLFFCENGPSIHEATSTSRSGRTRPSAFCGRLDDNPPLNFPLCTNHTTATPIPRLRKCYTSKNPMDQVQANFLRTFSLDQWTSPQRSGAVDVPVASSVDQENQADDDSFIQALIAEQCTDGTSPRVPRRIEIPPGLHDANENTDARMGPGKVKLQPKPNRRLRFGDGLPWDRSIDATMFEHVPRLNHVRSFSPTIDFCVVEPRALFDATDNDDGEDTSSSEDGCHVITENVTTEETSNGCPVALEDEEPSSNSILADHFTSSPTTAKARKRRSNSILSPESSFGDLGLSSVSDFVTPARLRYIRGLRQESNDVAEDCPFVPFLTSNPLNATASGRKILAEDDMGQSIGTTRHSGISQSVGSAPEKPHTPPSDDLQQHLLLPQLPTEKADVSSASAAVEATSKSYGLPETMSLVSAAGLPETISLMSAVGLQHRQAISHPSMLARGSFDASLSTSLEFIQRLQEEFGHTPERPPSPDSVQSIANAMGQYSSCSSPDRRVSETSHSRARVTLRKIALESRDPEISHGSQQANQLQYPLSNEVGIQGSPIAKQTQSEFVGLVKAAQLDENDSRCRSPFATPEQPQDCSCLSLSPTASCHGDGVSVDSDNHAHHSPTTLRRSTSTGALQDSRLWSDFMDGYGSHSPSGPSKSISAAMKIISKLSPRHYRERQRALYTRIKENDDFMNNFLYCSKPAEDSERQVAKAFQTEPCLDGAFSCGDGNAGFCCTSFINDAMTVGAMFHARRNVQSRSLVRLSSSGIAASQNRASHSWLEVATERLDNVVDNWVDGGRPLASTTATVSFQAPSLKKCDHATVKHAYFGGDHDETTTSTTAVGGDFDGIGLYDLDTSQTSPRIMIERHGHHSHHLSLLEEDFDSISHMDSPISYSGGHSRHDLSDSQFAIMYGVSRQEFEAKAKAARCLGSK